MTGFVWLVGAGCQRRELLTLAGREALERADVVVYDDLLADGLLEYARAGAELCYVGKREGRHSAAQEEINALLISLAREGRKVCRLKGGDPFVFGRGGEEALALQRAGVPYTVIPGVTSAVAVPALAGIPATHRGMSCSFHVITAHTADSPDGLPADLEKVAELSGTLVFLMGLSCLGALADRLMAAGMSPDTPAAVVGSRAVRGHLSDIARLAEGFPPPAVILVGGTAALDLTCQGLPLTGVKVGLTGTRRFQDRLRDALLPWGGEVRSVQTTRLFPACAPGELVSSLRRGPRWVAFTSPNGPAFFFQALAQAGFDLRGLADVKFAAVGSGAAAALEKYGFYADLIPPEPHTAALGAALAEQGEGPVLLAGASNASHAPETALTAAGVVWERLTLYRPDFSTVEEMQTDYLLFGSAGGVERYHAGNGPIPLRGAVCVGARTALRARELGFPAVAVAAAPTPEEMVHTLVRLVKGDTI